MFLLLVIFNLLISTRQECKHEIITNLKPEDCYKQNKYYAKENCLPICKSFPISGENECKNTNSCIPGYSCVSNKCAPIVKSCPIYHTNTTDNRNRYFSAVFKPQCDVNGQWAAKQCKGDVPTGRCFCFNAKGNRIFGQEWYSKAGNMTCACSRKRADLAGHGRYIGLHCDRQGNFEDLQCEDGLCWCVDRIGGLKSAIVPEQAMAKLPCYDKAKIGGRYLRQCESKKHAQQKIVRELEVHGTRVTFGVLLCDDDGSYGSYSVEKGHAYCTWRDGSKIPTFQQDVLVHLEQMNCNCARDVKIYEESSLELAQSCTNNGNYYSLQQIGLEQYCVDSDGFRNSRKPPKNEQDCYNSY